MYNFIPLYTELDSLVACANVDTANKFDLFRSTEFIMCRHKTLICESFYEDFEAEYDAGKIIPNYNALKDTTLITYKDTGKDYTLGSEVSLRTLHHLGSYLKKYPHKKFLEIDTHSSFFKINGELQYEIIPYVGSYERIKHCFYNKVHSGKEE